MCCISTHSTSSFVIPRGVHCKKYHPTYIPPTLSLHCWIILLDRIIGSYYRELPSLNSRLYNINQTVDTEQKLNLRGWQSSDYDEVSDKILHDND